MYFKFEFDDSFHINIVVAGEKRDTYFYAQPTEILDKHTLTSYNNRGAFH